MGEKAPKPLPLVGSLFPAPAILFPAGQAVFPCFYGDSGRIVPLGGKSAMAGAGNKDPEGGSNGNGFLRSL